VLFFFFLFFFFPSLALNITRKCEQEYAEMENIMRRRGEMCATIMETSENFLPRRPRKEEARKKSENSGKFYEFL
jgi:hypothetical protein